MIHATLENVKHLMMKPMHISEFLIYNFNMKREHLRLIVLLLDAYKLFHRQMYPSNTVTVYSNATARHCKHYKGPNKDYVISFGQQRLVRLLKDKFQDFFDLPHDDVMNFIKSN